MKTTAEFFSATPFFDRAARRRIKNTARGMAAIPGIIFHRLVAHAIKSRL
jgi:hypothetical protein